MRTWSPISTNGLYICAHAHFLRLAYCVLELFTWIYPRYPLRITSTSHSTGPMSCSSISAFSARWRIWSLTCGNSTKVSSMKILNNVVACGVGYIWVGGMWAWVWNVTEWRLGYRILFDVCVTDVFRSWLCLCWLWVAILSDFDRSIVAQTGARCALQCSDLEVNHILDSSPHIHSSHMHTPSATNYLCILCYLPSSNLFIFHLHLLPYHFPFQYITGSFLSFELLHCMKVWLMRCPWHFKALSRGIERRMLSRCFESCASAYMGVWVYMRVKCVNTPISRAQGSDQH